MPDTTTILQFPPFEGRDVTAATISIRNTGHGLEKAMEVAPHLFHWRDTVYVVLECEVEKIRHDGIDDTDDSDMVRVHMLKAGVATIVDKDLVVAQLREMEKRIEDHKAKADDPELDGQLDLEGQQHALDHEDGKHAEGLVDGCPGCQAESDAEAAERDDAA